MHTLKYSLEYGCFPIWEYDENGDLVDNDLPEKLRDDKELDSLLVRIQEQFDSLFTDTKKEFSSHDFSNESDRQEFLKNLLSSVDIIKQRYGNDYHVECKYTKDSFPS